MAASSARIARLRTCIDRPLAAQPGRTEVPGAGQGLAEALDSGIEVPVPALTPEVAHIWLIEVELLDLGVAGDARVAVVHAAGLVERGINRGHVHVRFVEVA